MKKIFTFLLMALLALAGFKSWGQETLTVCEGNATEQIVPVFVNYFDTEGTISQYVIPSSELTAMTGGEITALKFYISYVDATTLPSVLSSAQVTCKLQEVSSDVVSSIQSGGTQVFSGNLTASNSCQELDCIFDNAYTYQGGNLLVSFEVTDDGSFTWTQFFGINPSYNSAITNKGSDPDVPQKFIPKTTFTYTAAESCPKPTGLTASNITATGATISWNDNDAESYDFAYGVASTFNLENPSTYAVQNTTATSVQLSGLTAETEYKCAVKAHCSGEEESAWSSAVTFMPTAIQHLTINESSSNYCEYVPFYGYYADNLTKSQFIIPAASLTAMEGADITAFEFYTMTSGSSNGPANYTFGGSWDVYFSTVNYVTMPTSYEPLDGMDKVYTGNMVILNNKMTLTFSEPYTYEGGNLMICFNQTTSTSWQRTYWKGIATSEHAARAGYGGSHGNYYFLPTTTFTYTSGASCPKPKDLAVSNITATGATISWTGSAESYDLAYGFASTFNLENPSTYTLQNNLTTTSVTLSGLTAETEYKCAVKAHCSGDDESAWSSVIAFMPSVFQHLTVNDGTDTYDKVPFYGDMAYYNLTKSQFVIPASYIEDMQGCEITQLKFYVNSSSSYLPDYSSDRWNVYITEKDDPSGAWWDFFDFGTMTNVYSGSVSIMNNELTVTLDEPFQYNNKSLMIGFNQTNTGFYGETHWLGSNNTTGSAGTNRCRAQWSSSGKETKPFLPKTTFTYTPGATRYNVTVDNAITGGSISANPTEATAGTVVTLSATPAFGYEFGTWTVMAGEDPVTVTNNTFEMPESDVTVTATFNELTQYAITCATLAEGTIHAEYDGVTISEAPAGTEITLVAVPNTGYSFDHFTVDDEPLPGNTFIMPESNVTVSASFKEIPSFSYLDINDGSDGSTVTSNEYVPFYGGYSDYYLTKSQFIIPASSLADMEEGKIYELTFYLNNTANYTFVPQWDIFVKNVGETETLSSYYSDDAMDEQIYGGTIAISDNKITINLSTPYKYEGGNLLIYFKQKSNDWTNYHDTSWKGIQTSGNTAYAVGYGGGDSSYKFLPKMTFTYTPGSTRYNITLNQTEGGTISADMDKASAGTEVTLSHEADVFHTFGAWVEEYDDVTIVNDKFTMPEHDVIISATFNELTQYTINITPNDAATIHATYNDETISKAPEGLVINLSYDDLQPGYTFDSWKVVYNGKIDVDVIDNQFTMPNANVTVSAVFSELTAHTVTIAAVEGGTISVSANGEPISTGEAVYPGATLTFGNTPTTSSYQPLFKLDHYVVTEEGSSPQHLDAGVNTYTMPNCNLTVSAVFIPLYFPTLNVTGYSASVTLWAGPDNMNIRQVGGQYYPGVAAGEYVFINAEDIEGYRKTVTWSDSQGPHETITYPDDNRPCFVMPADNNVTVSVQYAVIQKYNIALDYNTEGGSITVSPSEPVAGGTLVHIYIGTPNLHFSFNASALSVTYNEGQSSVAVTTVTEGSYYQFSMPEGNVTVHAKFTEDENYAVSIVKPEGCDFDVTYQSGGQNPTTGNVYCGYKVYLRNLDISSGYRFDGWNVTYKNDEDDIPVEIVEEFGQTYFAMPQGPVTITADVTKLEEHNVTIVPTMGGTITVNGNSESFQALEGSTITMSYSNLLEGYIFDSWIITTSTNTYQTTNSSFSMLGEDLSVEAVFLKESIVNDGSDNNYYIPFHQTGYQWDGSDYNYVMTRSQFIIPATDLENVYDASITDMTFYTNNNAYAFDATWKVYVKEVEYTQFEETYQYEDVTNMTQVYNGTMTIENNKMKVHFDTPYQYNDGNLMISFVQQTTNTAEPWTYWYGVNSTNYSDRLSFGGYGSINFYSNFLPKTKFSYKPSETPTERYEITVNEVEGTTLSASRNLAAAGTVITLTEETSNEYIFNGWDVTSELGDVTVDENNQFTMPAANVTVSANVTPKQHYFVTLDEEMTNGTLSTTPESEIGYIEGTTVTIENQPNAGYKFDESYGVKAWKADDPTTEVEVTTDYYGYNITMPEYNIVISARFIPLTEYTITYHVNGVETPETVYENERIQPSDPQVPAGTSFVGWATSDIATYSETEPTLFETGDYPTSNMELYAVLSYSEQIPAIGKDGETWVEVTSPSDLSSGDQVIFVEKNNLKILAKRIDLYDGNFRSADVTISSNEINSIPSNAVVFEADNTSGSWKFRFEDAFNTGLTTLADYYGGNLVPLNMGWGGSDSWTIISNGSSVNIQGGSGNYIVYKSGDFTVDGSSVYKKSVLFKKYNPFITNTYYMTEVLTDGEVAANTTAKNIIITTGITVNNNIVLTMNENGLFRNENAANFVFKDGAEFIYTGEETVNATFEKNIVGYNDPYAIGDGWYFIANPTANTTVNLSGGNSYDLYTFNPAAAAEWHNVQYNDGSQILEGNIEISRETGYLYANSNNHTLRFEGGLLTSETEKVINLVYAEAGPGIDFPGFNLIGNPFPCTAYISGEFSIFKLIDGSEVQISEDGTVDPCEAFFVEATEPNTTVTISTTAPGKSRIMPIVVNSNRGETLDRAILHLEGTRNSHKFMMNPDRTNISFAKNGERFASVSRGDETEIPMNFTADHKGSYTISVNTENFEEEYLHLIDVVSGDDIDLLVTPSYTFEADADEYASRFRIVFGTTDINDNPATSSEPFVYISNGNLVINNVEGTASMQIVDMLGRIVRTETVCGSYNKPHNLKAGAYVITLDGRAQRIVIE